MSPEKQEVRKGPFARFIADGVRSGDVVTLSGQVSIDAKGAVVAPGDLVGQTRQVYGLIGGILSEFGATMENVESGSGARGCAGGVTSGAVQAAATSSRESVSRNVDFTQNFSSVGEEKRLAAGHATRYPSPRQGALKVLYHGARLPSQPGRSRASSRSVSRGYGTRVPWDPLASAVARRARAAFCSGTVAYRWHTREPASQRRRALRPALARGAGRG